MSKKWILEIIVSLLVGLFVYTALSKLLDYDTFRSQLNKSPFLATISGITAWALPLTELIAAVLLVVYRTRLTGLYLSFFLMALFTAYIQVMLQYSYYLPCSCGGVLASMSWTQHLIFNIAFTALAAVGVLLQAGQGNPKTCKTE